MRLKMLSLNNFPIICLPSKSVLDFSHARLLVPKISWISP